MTSGVSGLLIVGAGGHAKVVIEVARAVGMEPQGLLAPRPHPAEVLGVPVLGSDDDAAKLLRKGFGAAFIAIGLNSLRRKIGLSMIGLGYEMPTLIHPSATISPSATLGRGVAVMAGAVINASATIGDFSVINTLAIVEHDCRVGDGAHIAPRSVMGGGCSIGLEALFGIGSTARPGVQVGDRAIVGAGSVVIGEVPEGAVFVGAPARPIRTGVKELGN